MKLREKEEGESQLLKSFSPAKGGFGGRHQKSPSLWNEKEEASIPRIRLNNIFLLPPPAGLLRGCVYACCIRSFAVPKPKKQLFPNKLPLLSRLRRQDIKQSDRRVYWPLFSPPRHSEAFIVALYVWARPGLVWPPSVAAAAGIHKGCCWLYKHYCVPLLLLIVPLRGLSMKFDDSVRYQLNLHF